MYLVFTLHRLAQRIYFIRRLFIAVAILLGAFFIFAVVLGGPQFDKYLPASAALFGWSFCLYGIAKGFIVIPSSVTAHDSWLTRCKKKISFFVAWVFALVFILCTLGLLYVSYSTIRLSLATG